MSWEDEEFAVPDAIAAGGGTVAAAKPLVGKAEKSLEARSYEKREARALEEKAVLEVEAAAAKAAMEKARAEAKNTAASKAYIASLEKKAKAAAEAVVAKERAIYVADGQEGQRRHAAKCAKKGILQPCYERDVLGIERDERGKIVGYRMCGY